MFFITWVKEIIMATKKAKAAPAEEAGAVKSGRPASAETVEAMDKLKALAKRKNGVTNIEAAETLGFTTLRTSALASRMVKQGMLAAAKGENGRVTYSKAA